MSHLHLGIAQLRPAWGDKSRTVDIITTAVAEAAARDIEILAFSETFLSGYPFWVCRTNGAAFDDARQARAYTQFVESSVELGGPELALVTEAARDHGVSLYLGVNERGSRAARLGHRRCPGSALPRLRPLSGWWAELLGKLDGPCARRPL
jgi:nitrilase